jgi:hypothetical protein
MHEPVVAFSCDDVAPKTNVARLKELIRAADRFDVKITFFVVPKKEKSWQFCSDLVTTLRDIQSCGHEVGLHGLKHLPFEAGNPFDFLNLCYDSVRARITEGARLLDEILEITPRGFRAPYHHCNRSLFQALSDLGFLYDSSIMRWSGVLFSYFPPVRAVWVHGKAGFETSTMFHPFGLQLLEVPVALDFSWYNLGFEVSAFGVLFEKAISKMETGCLVVSSHIGALSQSGLVILRDFFLSLKQAGLKSSTLQEVTQEHSAPERGTSYHI